MFMKKSIIILILGSTLFLGTCILFLKRASVQLNGSRGFSSEETGSPAGFSHHAHYHTRTRSLEYGHNNDFNRNTSCHEKDMRNRLSLLSNYCDDGRKSDAEMFRNFKLSNILIDMKHKVIYCKVNKVASTTLLGFFRGKVGGIQKNIRLRSLVRNYIEARSLQASFSSFLFVRHPFDRLRSAYENKIADPRFHILRSNPTLWRNIVRHAVNFTQEGFNESLRNDNITRITFREFIQYILHIEATSRAHDPHWAPIERLCGPCQWNYQLIGHVETFHQDMECLQETFYQESTAYARRGETTYEMVAPPHHDGKYVYKTDLFQQLSREELDRLTQMYARDFCMFGYTPRDFM